MAIQNTCDGPILNSPNHVGSALYQQECTHYVSQAIKSGFTHIDTAQAYGNEQSVGKALAAHFSENPRESLFVTTKFDRLLPNESVRSVLEDQLRKLQVSYVDLYLVHWPVPFEGRLGPIWKEVEQLKRDGLAKEIGISNYRVEDLDELLPTITERPDGILPSVHQIELHPHVLDTTLPILEIGKKYGIQVASYGGLTPIIRMADGPVRAIAESIVKKWREARKDATVGHVMLKWLDAKGAIAVT